MPQKVAMHAADSIYAHRETDVCCRECICRLLPCCNESNDSCVVWNQGREKLVENSEHVIVVSEEQVVDGVAYFMARCILANPKTQVYVLMNCWKTYIRF